MIMNVIHGYVQMNSISHKFSFMKNVFKLGRILFSICFELGLIPLMLFALGKL